MNGSEGCKQTHHCQTCEKNPRGACPACTQRHRHAAMLRDENGLSLTEIASRMRLAEPRVERLLEEHDQYTDLQRYVLNAIPVEVVQALIKRRQNDDPGLTKEQIACASGYASRLALLRAVGLYPNARVRARGKEYPPKLRTTIDVGAAGRIVQALGFAPHEVPGL